MHIAYILPAKAGGGGVHSVIQESAEMARLGIEVTVFVPRKHSLSYHTHYARDITGAIRLTPYERLDDLVDPLSRATHAIATVFTSVKLLAEVLERLPAEARPAPAYYVQDYEPLFCEPESELWHEARASYEAIPGMLLMAKTRWLCDMVAKHHRREVHLIPPSIDHDTFYPDFSRPDRPRILTAMLRPSTPRRAPRRTARLLNWLATESDNSVEAHAFGCDHAALDVAGIHLDPTVTLHGILRREEVAALLRRSHFFLDASDYQAFGRTAVEAMASGCVPMVPAVGGSSEFVHDSLHGFSIIDPTCETESLLFEGLSIDASTLNQMRLAAVQTTTRLTARATATAIVASVSASTAH